MLFHSRTSKALCITQGLAQIGELVKKLTSKTHDFSNEEREILKALDKEGFVFSGIDRQNRMSIQEEIACYSKRLFAKKPYFSLTLEEKIVDNKNLLWRVLAAYLSNCSPNGLCQVQFLVRKDQMRGRIGYRTRDG